MVTLISFKNFVDEILADNSRNYKISILEKYKDYPSTKYYLDFIYNPFVVSGISDKKLSKAKEMKVSGNMRVIPTFEYIKQHNTGTDEDLQMIAICRNGISDDLKDLFDKIITKNLPLGIDAKTINKVIPGLIPEFNVMLANKYFDKPEVLTGKSFAITTKIDGGRIIAIKDNGVVSFYTRQGQKYEGLVDLEKEMSDYMPNNTVLDGELTLLDPGKLASKDQYKATMKESRKDGEKHGLKMLVFDMLSAEEFKTQTCKNIYSVRRNQLNNLFAKRNFTYFNLLPILYSGNDTEEITKWLDYNTSHGEEGIILNDLCAKYEYRRSNALLKVKKFQDIDLEIIGFEEGTNKHVGKLGAVLVRYKDGNVVKVGSGFTDELREEIWNHQSEWLGRIINVKYFEETTNAKGEASLRFPVYLDYRDFCDKATPDF